MTWFLCIIIVAVLAAAFVVAARGGVTITQAYDDRRDVTLPADRALRGDDLRDVRFTVGFRGYRREEVDALLARLGAEMSVRELPGEAPTPHDPEDPTARNTIE
ncbi:DivIVA domain-containing protein [Solicola gregarius]|uniref:DivIVA domain-containing protein n=1 Tax=Solicola gregarius TaxID=2908642 RepID=A0AA46YM46_9ACTN|nr:DivIVA domain-containing protein [Solicola gregarius]UYM06176.1 DivIVA domain-containing protein [Solicola gregarius]